MKCIQFISICSFLILGLFTQACKDRSLEDKQIDKLFDEVMAIHDDVMPKMSTIHRLKKKLKPKAVEDNAVQAIIEQLDNADEGMMEWMPQFKKPKGKSFEEAMAYLEQEKDKIIIIKKNINSAIAVAEEMVQ